MLSINRQNISLIIYKIIYKLNVSIKDNLIKKRKKLIANKCYKTYFTTYLSYF